MIYQHRKKCDRSCKVISPHAMQSSKLFNHLLVSRRSKNVISYRISVKQLMNHQLRYHEHLIYWIAYIACPMAQTRQGYCCMDCQYQQVKILQCNLYRFFSGFCPKDTSCIQINALAFNACIIEFRVIIATHVVYLIISCAIQYFVAMVWIMSSINTQKK